MYLMSNYYILFSFDVCPHLYKEAGVTTADQCSHKKIVIIGESMLTRDSDLVR